MRRLPQAVNRLVLSLKGVHVFRASNRRRSKRLATTAAVAVLVLWSFAAPLISARSAESNEQTFTETLLSPEGLAFDNHDRLYICDSAGHRLLCLEAGRLRVLAGTGSPGYGGDGEPAIQAPLRSPQDVVFDTRRNLLIIADTCNHRIRAVDSSGQISTLAGNGEYGLSGDGGPAVQARLNCPQGLAVDDSGNLYVADTNNHVVRRIDPQGQISTVAGSQAGLSGDGGPATEARLSLPMAVAVGPDGSLWICDSGNSRIRRISSDGVIDTLAGHGPGSGLAGAGFGGDGGPATSASLFCPTDIAFDRQGDLLICDSGNHRIRLLRRGVISTIAGNGRTEAASDESSPSEVPLESPQSIAVSSRGQLYIADRGNRRLQRLEAGALTTLVRAAAQTPSPHSASAIPRDASQLIDNHLFAAMQRDGIPYAAEASDLEFLRRVTLDLTGRIPSIEELQSFLADQSPDKRRKVVDRLLCSAAWADHWSYWYGDLFRNCANRIGNAATKHFDAFLRRSLAADKPYDQFVTELLTAEAPNTVWMPDAGAAAYLARWHIAGDSMYSDRPEDTADEIVIQSARFFLGINYQCISCHEGRGFLEKMDLGLVPKRRQDLWAMAAFFGGTRVRIVPFQDRFSITDEGASYDAMAPSSVRLARDGGAIEPTFLLSGEKADPSLPLRPQFARMLTTHPQFARATVNLIWKQFFGVGIVEPFDGFDLARQDPLNPPPAPWTVQPTHPELLDALARDFAAGGFRLKRLMRSIVNSRAYQLSSTIEGRWEDRFDRYFARARVRQLTAEQLHDAIAEATQVFGDYPRKDLLYGDDRGSIRFVTQAATPEEIVDGEARSLMRTFGQANREQTDRQSGGAIPQAMALMTSDFVARRVRADGEGIVGRLAASKKTNSEIVEELFLRSLSRPPSDEERRIAVAWLDEDRVQGAEDLQWSLLNKLDFLFNH